MILGVILAGGRGVRLGGVIKANIEIAGISLVDRVASALAGQCDAIVLSTGAIDPNTINSTTSLWPVPDAPHIEAGPVGGLAAAVAWVREQENAPDFILTVAVDTPFFPLDFVDRALQLMRPGVHCVMGSAPGAAGISDQAYPTNSLWRYAAIAKLPELLKTPDAPHGLRKVVDKSACVFVRYPSLSVDGCFANVNTPADLRLCTEIAERSLPVRR